MADFNRGAGRFAACLVAALTFLLPFWDRFINIAPPTHKSRNEGFSYVSASPFSTVTRA